MSSALSETLALLRKAREEDRQDAALVFFSGGKDSLACLDLATRTFPRVVAVHMYLVPGLECVEAVLDEARARWGVEVRQYPHWILPKFIRGAVYCDNWYERDELAQWTLGDVYNLARGESRIMLVVSGAKRADSLWRRRNLKATENKGSYRDVLYPVIGWSKADVLAYLKARDIPVPERSAKGNATGIDLSTPSLLWLHDNHPRDFAKLCEVFPYAEAVVWRRRFYGAEDEPTASEG